jgi:hypothetical protein
MPIALNYSSFHVFEPHLRGTAVLYLKIAVIVEYLSREPQTKRAFSDRPHLGKDEKRLVVPLKRNYKLCASLEC